MEYMGGGALDKLMRPGPFQEVYVAVLLREILKGLDYMHDQGKVREGVVFPTLREGVVCLIQL
jgi:serine/threonine-protein kinase 24/25/MST4